MVEYRAVCRAEEVAPGTGRLVEIDGKAIALFNVGETFQAMEDTCLHAGGPLHEGVLEGSIVTCPWHAWKFDVTSGRCSLNPKVTLSCYDVRVRDGMVEIGAS
ncbi:MAG: Rieske (2Fe-2S) protein [Planctomycetota bacterium]|jgi:nitrite reductase (NADH) small subunit/3-phenylpropionate/trans-cinnamate dioxygenase ferredoxin subunit